MTGTEIVNLITNVGFPISGCIFLGFYIMKRVDKMGEVVDNNTKAIMLLVSELQHDQNKKR